MNHLRKKKQEAFIGFMCINILEPPEGAEWGVFNDKVIKSKWLETFRLKFHNRAGPEIYIDKNVIDIRVKRHWIENIQESLQTIEGMTDRVPKMKLTLEGFEETQPKNLWVFSGNHRRQALGLYIADKKQEPAP